MSRDVQQVVRLVQTVLRLTRGSRMSMKLTMLIVVGVVGYFLAQPFLASKLGIDLPGVGEPSAVEAIETASTAPEPVETKQPTQPQRDASRSSKPAGKPAPKSSTTQSAPKLSEFMRDLGREVYESPAGLRYTKGSQHKHRLKHIMAHAVDEPNRPGQHGVFDSPDSVTVFKLIDSAYEQALQKRNTKAEQEGGRTVYNINVGRRIGYIGGQSGNRRGKPAAKHLRLVVQGKNVITAFPYRP